MTVKIKTESELEELLSRPDEATASAMAALDGDLLILGAGGKMGPNLARLARRAIETIACDLLDRSSLDKLPDIPNVIFIAARKFGTSGEEHLKWAMNAYLP